MYRQGDLLIIETNTIKGRKQKNRILALGEVTGHAHQLDGGDVYAARGEKYVELKKAQRLLHEEHGPIELPAGKYRVIRQREYKPATKRKSVLVYD